jgi:glycosyltransferase involved in cell wall biosynthesis
VTRTVAHVFDYGGPTGGSFIPAMESLARAVVARGDRFVAIATNVEGATWPAELKRTGATVHLIANGRDLAGALAYARPDIVHAHFTRYDLPVVRLAPWNARIFWHVHSHREDVSRAARTAAFLKYQIAGSRVEGIVAVSRTLAEECLAFAVPPRKLRVVQNGIDTHVFHPPNIIERASARREFGYRSDDRVVLFFERVPYKGGATVRAAMDLAPGLRILVAGGTAADREKYLDLPRARLTARASDARQLYWAADALAFASDNEAFGFVLAEALACGLPIAASDIPIVREVCGDVESVKRFPPRDPAALAQALLAASEPGHRSDAGRRRVVELFDLGRWTAEMLALYEIRSSARSRSY